MSGFLDGLLRVRVAPGADLAAAPSSWSFTDITSYVRFEQSISIEHGQRNEGGDAETAILRMVVDNRDARFSRLNPESTWFGQLSRNTPIEVAVQDNSVWQTRFAGFASFTPRWNEAGKADAMAVVDAYGVFHRLEQGAQALRSPLFRSLSTHANVVAYWPCEDNAGSTQAASPIAGVRPWAMQAEFSSVEGPAGSDSLLRVVAGQASMLARVPNHTDGSVYVAQVAWRMDEAAPAGGRQMLNVFTTSTTLARWTLSITDTSFVVRAWDADEVLVVNDSEAIHADLIGQWVRVELRLFTNASSVSWEASVTTADAESTILNDLSATESSTTKGRIVRVGVGDGGDWAQDRYFGHLAVLTGTLTQLPVVGSMDPLTSKDRHAPFHGWTGELAADRFERLCAEEDLTCTVLAPTGGLRESTGVNTDNASTPDAAALDITGDIDLRCWLSADDWADANFRRLVQKWETTGDQRSYALRLSSGAIEMQWSTDGTAGTESTIGTGVLLAPMPPDGGLLAVRATLDVNNGAAGHDVNIYRGPSLDGPWTLHHSETIAGTTSIFSGTASLKVAGDGNTTPLGLVRGARVYSGIAGTLVADPDFTAQTIGATSFDDDAGNTWTINGDAEIVRADDSMPMGAQRIDTLLNNLRQIVTADQGRLGEAGFGLQYRTHSSLTNQATAALEIPAGGMDRMPHPDDSTQQLRNLITVTRPDGSSATAQSNVSIQAEGRFPESITADLASEDDAAHLANWRLHVGTVDEYRWPQLHFALHRNTELVADWLALLQGDKVTAVHAFDELGSGVDIAVLAEGWTEQINEFLWFITINGSPASTHEVAVFDTARFDADDSETSGSFVAGTGTSLTVTSTGRPWVNSTDHASEFPFHIKVSGVVLNVTAISGASSPQTFTVDATTVNGVTKTIPSGSAVVLADTPVFAY